MGRHHGGCIHLQRWPVKASVQSKGLWRQFGRAAKLRSAVNKEDGEKVLDESLRNGEGMVGLQGLDFGGANLRLGFAPFSGVTSAGLGWVVSASSKC